MFGSNVLEAVIGLFFIYLLVSLVCSAVNEIIAALANLRSTTLRDSINMLLVDDTLPELAGKFWSHPIIVGLGVKSGNLPSYIGSDTFARALLDVIPIKDDTRKPQTPAEALLTLLDSLSNLSQKRSHIAILLSTLLKDSGVDSVKIEQAAQTVKSLGAVRAQLAATIEHQTSDPTNPASAQQVLSQLDQLDKNIQQAQNELEHSWEAVQASVATYFDEAMKRVSGWYKRLVQWIIIGLAITVTVLLNADTISIATQLINDSSLRQAVIEQANNTTSEAAKTQAAEVLDKLESLGIHLGWTSLPIDPIAWFQKLVGLAITAAAASLGAPFWFELLSKLVNLRLTGARPN